MIRRLRNAAAIVSLVVAPVLIVAVQVQAPLQPRWIGNPNGDGWAAGIHLGRVMITRVTNGALLSVPFAASLQSLAVPFAVLPLVWGVVLYRQERCQRARGFLVEPAGK